MLVRRSQVLLLAGRDYFDSFFLFFQVDFFFRSFFSLRQLQQVYSNATNIQCYRGPKKSLTLALLRLSCAWSSAGPHLKGSSSLLLWELQLEAAGLKGWLCAELLQFPLFPHRLCSDLLQCCKFNPVSWTMLVSVPHDYRSSSVSLCHQVFSLVDRMPYSIMCDRSCSSPRIYYFLEITTNMN